MSAAQFAAEDKALRAKALALAAKGAAGPGGKELTKEQQLEDTVYRDKRGRKLDMLNEMMRQQAIREGKAVAEAEEQMEWGKGTVQKAAEKFHQEELKNIALEPFARTKDDAKVDAYYREQIHADDPMAAYMVKKRDAAKAKRLAASGGGLKPVYKGPAPRPNRFGIRPGYRWDGRDRGSAWEERVFLEKASKARDKDAAYLWSTSDM